jgi:hypothetical protein
MRIGIQPPSFSFGGDPAVIGPTFGRLAREADEAGLDKHVQGRRGLHQHARLTVVLSGGRAWLGIGAGWNEEVRDNACRRRRLGGSIAAGPGG